MKYLFSLLVLLFSCELMAQSVGKNQSKEESKVQKIAKRQCATFLNSIPEGEELQFGYSGREEMNLSTTGRPICVLNLTKEFYSASILGNTNYIIVGNEWRVPLTVKGRNKTLLTVNYRDGNYSVTDIGGAVLAAELQEQVAKAAKNSHYYMLRIYPLTADFFAYGDGKIEDLTFYPLTSACMAMPSLNKRKAYTAKQVLISVKDALKKTL